ncbi:hypothetical protein HK105_201233 [Polyrhizophydium stewartii]|uniref:Ankyrin repeat protein n=1 Tax=Polyrhizophydium stewartii TaxID=2732419 RepID=A0ABR4NHF4_9FUNG|nr:hypothetical protein HK105_000266 [Polyrhizophydium stewartii]
MDWGAFQGALSTALGHALASVADNLDSVTKRLSSVEHQLQTLHTRIDALGETKPAHIAPVDVKPDGAFSDAVLERLDALAKAVEAATARTQRVEAALVDGRGGGGGGGGGARGGDAVAGRLDVVQTNAVLGKLDAVANSLDRLRADSAGPSIDALRLAVDSLATRINGSNSGGGGGNSSGDSQAARPDFSEVTEHIKSLQMSLGIVIRHAEMSTLKEIQIVAQLGDISKDLEMHAYETVSGAATLRSLIGGISAQLVALKENSTAGTAATAGATVAAPLAGRPLSRQASVRSDSDQQTGYEPPAATPRYGDKQARRALSPAPPTQRGRNASVPPLKHAAPKRATSPRPLPAKRARAETPVSQAAPIKPGASAGTSDFTHVSKFLADPKRKLSRSEFVELWREVFSKEWPGDLGLLPVDYFRNHACFEPFWMIRSREMYMRVRGLGHAFLEEGLIHAAIRNFWPALLNFQQPKVLAAHAARCGTVRMFIELVDKRRLIELDDEHARLAASYGHLALLKWLSAHMRGRSWLPSVLDFAAKYGHLDCVKWLSESRQDGCTTEAMEGAAENGHLSVVEWLHTNRREGCTENAIWRALANGYMRVALFLDRNRKEAKIADAALRAARTGNMQVLVLLRGGVPETLTDAVADEAALLGNTHVLDWLVANTSARCTAKGVTAAARCGQLRVLAWYRDRQNADFCVHPMSRADNKDASEAIAWFADLPAGIGISEVMNKALGERRSAALLWLLCHIPQGDWPKEIEDRVRVLMSG